MTTNVDDVITVSTELVEVQGFKTTKVFKSVVPYVDIGSLLIEDLDPFDVDEYKAKQSDYLTVLARDNVQYLINKIWELPVERVEDAIVVKLPDPTSRIPREKPIPKVKPETKWERYAKLKGIKNKKKSRVVWDEESKSWKPRWGYKRAKDDTKDWVVEIPDQKDAYHDYIGERIEKKKEKVAKNELQRLRNLRNQQKSADESVGLAMENKSAEQLSRQVNLASKSTASMGKFTEKLANEKAPKNSGRKRKFLPNETNVGTEKAKQMEILQRMSSKRPKIDVEKAVSQHVQEQQKRSSELNNEDGRRTKSQGKNRRSKSGSKGGKKNFTSKKSQGNRKNNNTRNSNRKNFGSKKINNKRNKR